MKLKKINLFKLNNIKKCIWLDILIMFYLSFIVSLVFNFFIAYHGPKLEYKKSFVYFYNIGGISQIFADTILKISEAKNSSYEIINNYWIIIFSSINLLLSIPLIIFSYYKISKRNAILNFSWVFIFFFWFFIFNFVIKHYTSIIGEISWKIDQFILQNIGNVKNGSINLNKNFQLNHLTNNSKLLFITTRLIIGCIISGLCFGVLYKKGCSFANLDTLIKYYCLKYKKTNFIKKLQILNISHLIINILIKSYILKNKGDTLNSSNVFFLLFASIMYIIFVNNVIGFIFKKFKLISIYIISSKYKEIQKELHLNNYKYNGNISFIKDFENENKNKVKINIITSLENYEEIEKIIKKIDNNALIFITKTTKVNQNYKI